MAFYSGSASSFEDLLTALASACATEGWVWADGILSKGAAYIRPYTSAANTTSEGLGLLIQGGTGKSGGALTGASGVIPRLGRAGATAAMVDISFPVAYSIHVFDSPDEVYLFIRYSVDRFSWLAFGVSSVPGLPGTGLWLAACARRGYMSSGDLGGFSIRPDSGGGTGINNSSSARCSPGLFWVSDRASNFTARQDCIHANIDGEGWSGQTGGGSGIQGFNAIYPVFNLITYSPSPWNGESILIPIQPHIWRASNKCSLVADLGHARYVRIDNYEPEQIISIGPDQWKIYPFAQKNSEERDGATYGIAHSGTFGIAIRYDGP
ncbi:hypothetical protein H3221_011800 [Pseudomonas sp. LMG 31766]|uniref:Virion structural protein n=1 Tax=Pseudomonas chaetocerotis TaxID=2758695 RepID=A0A931D3H2_9PSED|nr:hypothetical protein [Pseudomonas chaetocerotis]MBZ9665432.1 hypothetical protein [Pseudomonas chaetocerotis]